MTLDAVLLLLCCAGCAILDLAAALHYDHRPGGMCSRSA